MQKILLTLLLAFLLAQGFGQSQNKVSVYLQGQFNKTITDRTVGNNPWGTGVGLQGLLNSGSKLKPTLELTTDLYLEDDKVLRSNPDGSPIDDVETMVNLFTGASYHPSETVYFSLVGGPSFQRGNTLRNEAVFRVLLLTVTKMDGQNFLYQRFQPRQKDK